MRLNTNIFLGLAAVLLFFASCELESTCNKCFEVSHEQQAVSRSLFLRRYRITSFTLSRRRQVCKDNFRLIHSFRTAQWPEFYEKGTPCAIVGGRYSDDARVIANKKTSDLTVTNEIEVCDD